MLDRAATRVGTATTGRVTTIQGDIREITLPADGVDIVLASAVLHHLRTDVEWRVVFERLFAALRPAGSMWIFDLVDSASPAVREIMQARYGDYLVGLKDAAYRDEVLAYIDKEDMPRPLAFQLDLMRKSGSFISTFCTRTSASRHSAGASP